MIPQRTNSGRPWREEEDAFLIEQIGTGLSRSEIAHHLERAYSSVNTRVQHLRQTGRLNPFKPAVKAATEELRKSGQKVRPCLRCTNDFSSTGPMNRLCPRCRNLDVSPYAP